MEKCLKKFYEDLPRVIAPKTEFVNKVAARCGVNAATVRLWVKGKVKPSEPEYMIILSEETGIEIDQLFQIEK